MKIKDVANKYSLDLDTFNKFLLQSDYVSQLQEGSWSGELDTFTKGADINEIVASFQTWEGVYLERLRREEAEQAAAEEAKRAVLASMLITSGFNFDGYTITKYSGYISGDDAVSVDRGFSVFGSGSDIKGSLMESLVVIRRNALQELKEAAYALGCNAVIGVDFDYLTLDPQTANISGGTSYQPYIFGVTANGNAVIIEKNK